MKLPQDQQELTTRIGVISPDDGINDDEYYHYLPDGVTLLWTRFRTPQRFDPISIDMVASYGDLEVVREAALTLRITRPRVTMFLCNSCSFVHGPEGDRRIREVVADTTGGRATSITDAQVQALRLLGAHRVAVVAPYPEEVTAKLLAFLREVDFTVVASRSMGMTTEWRIGNTPARVWREAAREVDSPTADAILFACSGIRTAPILAELERELDKPVVSAPAVVIWRALRLAGLYAPVKGFGTLLENH